MRLAVIRTQKQSTCKIHLTGASSIIAMPVEDSHTKIAVCFFGITRSLSHTIGQIDRNVLGPARSHGRAKVFAHFFRQSSIVNVRSNEVAELDPCEHKLLNPDWLSLEEPEGCLDEHNFGLLQAYGDSWSDDFASLRNLIHQLHSMHKATKAALAWQPDVVIFARPDLLYHDSLAKFIRRAICSPHSEVILPNWQHWEGGYNDRFAICRSASAAEIYGTRVCRMRDFCETERGPVHSERLLRFVLDEAKLKPRLMPVRATRVRADGRFKKEDFSGPQSVAVRRAARNAVNSLGLRPAIDRLMSHRKDG